MNETSDSNDETRGEPSAVPEPSAMAADSGEETLTESVARDVDPEATIDAGLLNGNAASSVRTESRFGDYELVHEIARGGMGVVYRARHTKLNRIVALKMILAGQLASSRDVERFHIEAEAAANLEHPGIVPIYEIGECEGQHYFTMGFVEGTSLYELLADGPLPVNRAAKILLKTVEAIAHAHEHGIVHRDLKPANILITKSGEPVVTDFGLAKHLDTGGELTGTGQILGTPGYMSPEQAAGASRKVDSRADVYALGALLYAMLSGHAPFNAASVMETIRQVVEQEPVPLRLVNRDVPPQLEAMCQKCLAKSPDERYQSAAELLADVRRFVNGESLSVEMHSPISRMLRSLGRSRFDTRFGDWGNILCWLAPVVGVPELVLAWLCREGPPYPLNQIHGLRVVQCLLLCLILWSKRKAWSLKVGTVERQMIATCLGFFLACVVVLVTARTGIAQGIYPADEEYVSYQFLFIISGFMFTTLGANYWGGCYAIAGVFFLLAPLSILWLPLAPVAFGLSWSVVLFVVGRRLISLGRTHNSEQDERILEE